MQAVFNARVTGPPAVKNTRDASNETNGRVRVLSSLLSHSSLQFEGAFNFKSFDNYSEKHAREKVCLDSKVADGRNIGSLFQPLKALNNAKPEHVNPTSNSDQNQSISGHGGIKLQVFNDFAATKNMMLDDGSTLAPETNKNASKEGLDDVSPLLKPKDVSASLKTSDNIFENVAIVDSGEKASNLPRQNDNIVISANSESTSVLVGNDSSKSNRVSRFSDKSASEINTDGETS